MQILYNEVSKILLEFMENYNVDFQLIPEHIHLRNAVERTNRTWKNHFLSGISSVDGGFPMHLRYWLLHQVDITLNLIRPKRINPTLSAYNMIWVTLYFNWTPMGPPGCKIIVYEKPVKRGL